MIDYLVQPRLIAYIVNSMVHVIQCVLEVFNKYHQFGDHTFYHRDMTYERRETGVMHSVHLLGSFPHINVVLIWLYLSITRFITSFLP